MTPAQQRTLQHALKNHDAVYVEWLDSMGYQGWVSVDDLKPRLPTLFSIGFVMQVNDLRVTLAGSFDRENENVSCVIDMPLFAVTAVKAVTW